MFLALELNKIEFYYTEPTDKNRAIDGLELRKEFIETYGNDELNDILPGLCTALELLVAMSMQADFTMFDTEVGPRPGQWFWLFIKNLGLDYLTDDVWTFEAKNFVFATITKWFDKRYSPQGVGSPWPNPFARTDLTKVPMWDCMQWYLADNVDVL